MPLARRSSAPTTESPNSPSPSKGLTGYIPSELGLLTELKRLSLPHNNLHQKHPSSLFNATKLVGNLPVAVSLDLCDNNLTGEIPQVGSKASRDFPEDDPENPNQNPNALQTGPGQEKKLRSGSLVLAAVISGVSVTGWWFCCRRGFSGDGGGDGRRGVWVGVGGFVEGFCSIVVGRGRSGIVYKVVGVGKGSFPAPTVVAVRRLSEGDDATLRFKEFESEVEAIGRVRHPNVVPLRAYYYASDEKLLITDFIRNGSLHTALHGITSHTVLFH
ncbi:Protein kinase domain [Sesbania bispinosa]|nr:Protein kinase domain [Sesbania bispinosa]